MRNQNAEKALYTGKLATQAELFCENGDRSFLLYFSKQCLVGNTHGKFKKNRPTTSSSKESP